jgi:hypothetical protein
MLSLKYPSCHCGERSNLIKKPGLGTLMRLPRSVPPLAMTDRLGAFE